MQANPNAGCKGPLIYPITNIVELAVDIRIQGILDPFFVHALCNSTYL